MGDHDHLGQKRDDVTVLRGDPELVADVGDSLDFKWKYSSGIIAFAPGDDPDPFEIDQILNQFEELSFAGLPKDRRCYTAIRHGDHIHILAARVDLGTGKSFNPAPPGHLAAFDSLRDFWNYRRGWARPDDPERSRRVQPVFFDGVDADRTQILKFLDECIQHRSIKDHASLHRVLGEYFDITRSGVGKNGTPYISVRSRTSGKICRLKGEMFCAAWSVRTPEPSATPDPSREAENAAKRFVGHLERRCAYNLERYKIDPETWNADQNIVPAPATLRYANEVARCDHEMSLYNQCLTHSLDRNENTVNQGINRPQLRM